MKITKQYGKDVMCERRQKNKGAFYGEARSSEWGAHVSGEPWGVCHVPLSMYIMIMNAMIDSEYPLILPKVVFNALGSISTCVQGIFFFAHYSL